MLYLSVIITSVFLGACNPQAPDMTEDEPEGQRPKLKVQYEESGEHIARIAQSELIRNLTEAIERGGTEHAVEFCNTRISPLMDSLSDFHHAEISRLSLNNRAPGNAPDSRLEQQQMEAYQALSEKHQYLKDTIYNLDNRAVYFKPIVLTNALCLRCHGKPREQIDTATFNKITELYPEDKATDYELGDFRGTWKVEFEKAAK